MNSGCGGERQLGRNTGDQYLVTDSQGVDREGTPLDTAGALRLAKIMDVLADDIHPAGKRTKIRHTVVIATPTIPNM